MRKSKPAENQRSAASFKKEDAIVQVKVVAGSDISVFGVRGTDKWIAVRTGYEAAAWLDRLMAGEAAPDSPVLIAPTGVAPRRSTDIVAVDDQHVAAALRYIRDHACEDIALQDVLQSVHLSRASLHRHFNAALGRSPKAEILRVRLERARQLLAETELPPV